jgi:hypothetical protein
MNITTSNLKLKTTKLAKKFMTNNKNKKFITKISKSTYELIYAQVNEKVQ